MARRSQAQTKGRDRPPTTTMEQQADAGGVEAVGIDLGTTNSCVAVWRGASAEVIANSQGNRIIPSRVCVDVDPPLAGDAAATQHAAIFDIKRMMGRAPADVSALAALWPFGVEEDDRGRAAVRASDGRLWSPETLSSLILRELCATAAAYLGRPPARAVITVPAYFNDAQRQATKVAGERAGLDVLRIINEPTAAAMAYGMAQERAAAPRRILVFDWGGGTLDVSILRLEGEVFRVESTAGDSELGGQDVDAALVEHALARPPQDSGGVEARAPTPRARQRLRKACERAKRMLSGATQACIEVEAFYGEQDLRLTLSRAKMEEVCAPLWARLMAPVEAALEGKSDALDCVVLVGGSTRTPKVRALLEARFPGVPLTSRGIHPDEAVACGAALQAAVLTRACPKKVLLIDVTPITLGVETAGGVRTAVLPRNSTVPCRVTHRFSTYLDRQSSVRIKVLEGERPVAAACNTLGTFELDPIPPLPKGTPVIEVTFHVNVDGILAVSAVETSSKVSQELTVTRWNARDKQGRRRQQQEEAAARKHQEKDETFTETVRARHGLECTIFDVSQEAQTPAFRRAHARAGCDDIVGACQDAREWMTSAAAAAASVDTWNQRGARLRQMLAAAPPAPPQHST